MRSQRDNVLSLLKRRGFEYVPNEFLLCPSLVETYRQQTGSSLPYQAYFQMPWRRIEGMSPVPADPRRFDRYHDVIDKDTEIDWLGVGHRSTPTSMHMTQMLYPLAGVDSVEQIDTYPLPVWREEDNAHLKDAVAALHDEGIAALGNMQCTIWENAWYLRGMENLMMDMMTEDDMAVRLLDRVTEMSTDMARIFARAGADIIFLGDDIGMQQSIMMSETLYCEWIQPRLKSIITEIKRINPEIVVIYHTCGYVTPMIPHLIEAGIDVLNPVQPECMDFADIFDRFGGKLSFNGTVGTQTTMPFGSPSDVRKTVEQNMRIAGDRGGLLPSPTHLLEPEVPWENILAYVDVCKNFAG